MNDVPTATRSEIAGMIASTEYQLTLAENQLQEAMPLLRDLHSRLSRDPAAVSQLTTEEAHALLIPLQLTIFRDQLHRCSQLLDEPTSPNAA